MLTFDQQEKVLSGQNVIMGIFLQIRNLFWTYDELNRSSVGTSLIPLNMSSNRTTALSAAAIKLCPLTRSFFWPLKVGVLRWRNQKKSPIIHSRLTHSRVFHRRVVTQTQKNLKEEVMVSSQAKIINTPSQSFQSFFITDIATYRLNQPRGQIVWNA